jgi:hypothetical protein
MITNKKFTPDDKWCEELTQYIISIFWNLEKYKNINENNISAIFLAWAPWAWKTEFLEKFFYNLKQSFIIIDIDNYRKCFKWYNWENASEYQQFSVKVADKIFKFCIKNNLNFIFDGTFRNYNKVKQNFIQLEKYKKHSLIVLVFQDPRISYYYTFLRKLKKSRNVPIDVFIDWFYNSIENSFKAKTEFKNTTLWIAQKKYSIFNKNKFVYNVETTIKSISVFCKNYYISYKKGKFLLKNKLAVDIKNYNNIMERQFSWKWTKFWKFKIWFWEKFYKLFSH